MSKKQSEFQSANWDLITQDVIPIALKMTPNKRFIALLWMMFMRKIQHNTLERKHHQNLGLKVSCSRPIWPWPNPKFRYAFWLWQVGWSASRHSQVKIRPDRKVPTSFAINQRTFRDFDLAQHAMLWLVCGAEWTSVTPYCIFTATGLIAFVWCS